MKTAMLLFSLVVAGVVIGGCEAGPQKLDEKYAGQNAEQLGIERRNLFLKVNGNFDQLSPEDKKKFVDGFNGDEASARKYWDVMKNPPTSTLPSQAPIR